MSEQTKTIGFAAIVCITCSLLLSVIYSSLKDEQDMNKKNDVRKKVLSVFGEKGLDEKSSKDIEDLFNKHITPLVLDSEGKKSDKKIDELTPEEINERGKNGLKQYYPLYIYTDSDGSEKYAIHVSGMGLWSVIKGYMAFKSDLSTISGIAFYENNETPGLGGEIDNPKFRDTFDGKVLVKNNAVQTFEIVKKGTPLNDRSIDGISGATMTGNGVQKFINSDFKVYNKYFEKIRKK